MCATHLALLEEDLVLRQLRDQVLAHLLQIRALVFHHHVQQLIRQPGLCYLLRTIQGSEFRTGGW